MGQAVSLIHFNLVIKDLLRALDQLKIINFLKNLIKMDYSQQILRQILFFITGLKSLQFIAMVQNTME